MVSIFIFVPLYIRYLGIEDYAVIGFYALLLGVISFADSGMSSAIIKEFAIDQTSLYKYSVLRKIENLYWSICIILCISIVLCSNLIAGEWLTSDTISHKDLTYYVILIGIGVTFQLLSSLYYGSLFGLDEQVKANLAQIIWSFFKSAIVILLFFIIKPTLEVYLIWQIICNVLYVSVLRFMTIQKLKKNGEELRVVLSGIPSRILKYIGGMTLIAIISAVNTQADKIITSSFFSLKIFGYYNIASILAQIPVVLSTPLSLFVFPLFSKFSYENNNKLDISFDKISFLLSLLVIPSTVLLIIYAKEFIVLWAGATIDNILLPHIVIALRMLVLGSLFLALQFPLFYLLLSKNETRYTIYQGGIQIIIGLPLLYFCASLYGLRAVAIPWIFINFGSLVYLTIVCFRKYIKIYFLTHFVKNILTHTVITVPICLLFYYLYNEIFNNFYIIVVFSGLLSILGIIVFNNLRNNHKISDIKNIYNFPQ